MEEKICSKCRVNKPLSDFYKNKWNIDGYHHYCKTCHSENSKNRYWQNDKARESIKEGGFIRKYGLTFDDVNVLFDLQNRQCAICHREIKNKRHRYVDHNHVNNQVRGILCPSCNTIIGLAKDDIGILMSSILYISEKTFEQLVSENK